MDKTHLVVEQESKYYSSAIEDEREAWDRVYRHRSKKQKLNLSYKKTFDRNIIGEENSDYLRYCNMRTGIDSDSTMGWIDLAHKKLGNFGSGLSLGSGEGRYEKYMIKIGFVNKFESLDIVDESTPNTDLNFMELSANRYDLILAKSILHHLVNLEHILFQVKKALKPGGVFIVRDHIGETRHIWNRDKLDFLNSKFKERYHKYLPGISLSVKDRPNTKPFECIRSKDIPEIIDYYFSDSKLFEYKWGSLSYTFMSLIRGQASKIRNDRIFEDMVKYGIILDIKHGSNFWPCSLLAAYSKGKDKEPMFVEHWSDEIRAKYFVLQKQMLAPRKKIKMQLRTVLEKINPEIRWI